MNQNVQIDQGSSQTTNFPAPEYSLAVSAFKNLIALDLYPAR